MRLAAWNEFWASPEDGWRQIAVKNRLGTAIGYGPSWLRVITDGGAHYRGKIRPPTDIDELAEQLLST